MVIKSFILFAFIGISCKQPQKVWHKVRVQVSEAGLNDTLSVIVSGSFGLGSNGSVSQNGCNVFESGQECKVIGVERL
jgi:hypothetical protein